MLTIKYKYVLNLIATCVCSIFLFSSAFADGNSSITVTDMLNRTVTLASPAQRIVVAESRHILTLALIDKDPVKRIVGWGNDLRRFSPETYEVLVKAFPDAKKIPEVGGLAGSTFSMEAVIALKPDLVIFSLYGPVPDDVGKLDAAKIPYIFVDFFQKPLEKTVPSMQMLGKLIGHEQEAQDFIDYYQKHMNNVTDRVKGLPTYSVFFHVNPDGKDCCVTSGPGNMSDFIAAAGGMNIGLGKIPGSIGKLNLEYVISRNPDFYLIGGGSTAALDGLKVGTNITHEMAKQSLEKLLQAPGIKNLDAVKKHQAAGLWLFFFDTPLFFIGVEEMAKIFHPDSFKDLNPDQTLAEINEHYLAFPLSGTFWISDKVDGK